MTLKIEEMVEAGIHVCISSGNSAFKADVPGGIDYNNYVRIPVEGTNNVVSTETINYHRPASPYHEKAYFVGNIASAPIGSSKSDAANDYSVRGPAVNIWAPGSDIMSASSSNTTGSKVFDYPGDARFKIESMTGTSQSSPAGCGCIGTSPSESTVHFSCKINEKGS